ncbi:MAG: nucleoside-diphosphate sugar epimerase/dehydratase [Candidatus Acidiferrales bacterium]|jgi:FlaA1/EpsC-like NDP-sugar epimerase
MNSLLVAQAPARTSWTLQANPAASAQFTVARVAGWAWRKHRSALVLGAELFLAAVSYSLAVFAVAETRGVGWPGRALWATLGVMIVFRLGGLVSVQLYRRSLQHASVPDFISIVKAVATSSLLAGAATAWVLPALRVPAAALFVDAAFLILLWAGFHFGARVLKTERAEWRKDGKRVMVVGAGDAGITLLKDLAQDAAAASRAVAIVDDNPEKWGRTILGVPVVGGTRDLARLAAVHEADEILICIPSATGVQMRDILAACRQIGIPVRTLPSLSELVDGKVSRRDLRRPRIEDLLQREGVRVDVQQTRRIVGGKVVLVTGAGGSIGSELCRQIAEAGPRMLLLLDKSENSLFYVHRAMCEQLGASRVKPLLADLVYKDRLREILRQEKPEIVFHAAAHKHVGLLELHPQEAIRNNVLGTRNLAEAALECGAARLVNISTDKAVSPRSYLGLSKKLTELCVQELARAHGAKFSSVRFGNVAGSTGSVLRLFWDQIQKGGPIRVTDPRATRYFMSVPEAVHLILRAAALGNGGETFVFDMGEPLNIYELAKTMMLFAGLKPERDVAIEFTGLNEGEKIAEELWEEWERPAATANERILVVAEQNAQAAGILKKIERMETFLAHENYHGLLEYLGEFAPEFKRGRTADASAAAVMLPAEISALAGVEAA